MLVFVWLVLIMVMDRFVWSVVKVIDRLKILVLVMVILKVGCVEWGIGVWDLDLLIECLGFCKRGIGF